jgi:hypothetical protein
MFGAGAGAAAMYDEVQDGSAGGVQLTARVGYAFRPLGRFVLMLDVNSGHTGLEHGGTFSMTTISIIAEVFVRDRLALLAGVSAAGVSAQRDANMPRLRDDEGGAFQIGLAHDVWRSPRSNSVAIEGRVSFLSLRDKAEIRTQRSGATLATLGAVFQWW